MSLFEAAADVDSGVIYAQDALSLDGSELVQELRRKVVDATHRLCNFFLDSFPDIVSTGKDQVGDATYYSRRRPADSQIDPSIPLLSQFNLFRVTSILNIKLEIFNCPF